MTEDFRKYETVVLFDPMLPDAQLKAEVQKVQQLIETHAGKIERVNQWGKKEIGHPIKNHKYAAFVCYDFTSTEGSTIEKVASTLRMNESVLRFQTVRNYLSARKYKGNPYALARAIESGSSFDDSDVLE